MPVIGRRVPVMAPLRCAQGDRALACTDHASSVVQCARPDKGSPVRAPSAVHADDRIVRPIDALNHSNDCGSARDAWPARCWPAAAQCYIFERLGARQRPPLQPLRSNALMVFDASFAHHERIGSAVEAAATPGPCGGRTRRQCANVMVVESWKAVESLGSDWYSSLSSCGRKA